MSLLSTVVMIALHGGPADHLATFAEQLRIKGHEVEIYAAGPALQKLQARQISGVHSFSLADRDEETIAKELVAKCQKASVVLTDVGHVFDITLQKTLATSAPQVLRIAYYDNPESYVPGGYSETATKVMQAAQRVLFANANLAKKEGQIGIGYYPIAQAEGISKRRSSPELVQGIREQLFSACSLTDKGQKIFMYAGGNNEEYFEKALPAFLQFIQEAAKERDLSNSLFFIQQHPGAKEKDLDGQKIRHWLQAQGQSKNLPLIQMSPLNSEEAQVVADAMLYYQTSMGPQFVLAGIPTFQIGHDTYEDLLVKNGVCPSVTNKETLLKVLTALPEERKAAPQLIYKALGLCSDWTDRLEQALQVR